ncbi:hypothetical protein E2320_013726 [Naja naja]|nr:hypothetical protein E2320_013726 [Naja naja]
MARPSGWLLLELALNAAALLAALGCATALGLAQGGFGSRCILYGSVGYNKTLSLLSSSPPSLCYFISAISGLTAIFTLVSLLAASTACAMAMDTSTCLFFLLVSACVLRVGMDVFCGSIQKSKAATAWVNFLFWFLMCFLLFVECIRKAPYQPIEEESAQTDKTVPAFGDQSA